MPKILPSPFPFSDASARPPFDWYYFQAMDPTREYVCDEHTFLAVTDYFLSLAREAHYGLFHSPSPAQRLKTLEALASVACLAKALAEAAGLCPIAGPRAPSPKVDLTRCIPPRRHTPRHAPHHHPRSR